MSKARGKILSRDKARSRTRLRNDMDIAHYMIPIVRNFGKALAIETVKNLSVTPGTQADGGKDERGKQRST